MERCLVSSDMFWLLRTLCLDVRTRDPCYQYLCRELQSFRDEVGVSGNFLGIDGDCCDDMQTQVGAKTALCLQFGTLLPELWTWRSRKNHRIPVKSFCLPGAWGPLAMKARTEVLSVWVRAFTLWKSVAAKRWKTLGNTTNVRLVDIAQTIHVWYIHLHLP